MYSRLRKSDYWRGKKIWWRANIHKGRSRSNVSPISGNVIKVFSDFYGKIIMKLVGFLSDFEMKVHVIGSPFPPGHTDCI